MSFSLLSAVDTTTIVFIVLLVVLIVALLVVPMFTNKKRAKQTEELHRSLQPGDLIKTVGGVIGTIKEIRQVSPVDREMVIETGEGENKTTMVFDIQALYQVMSRNSTTVAATEEAEANTEDTAVEADKAAEELNAENAVASEAVAQAPVEEKVEEKAVEEQAATEDTAVAEEAATETPAEEQAAVEEKKAAKPKAATPAKKKPVSSAAKKTTGTTKNTKK